MKRKYVLSTLLVIFLAAGIVGSVHAADYYIDYFKIRTITEEDGSHITHLYFQILDKYGRIPVEDHPMTATVTFNNEHPIPFPSSIHRDLRREWRIRDYNLNGTIEKDEFELLERTSKEYRIVYSESPHSGGTYELNVTYNGQELIPEFINVSDAIELPKVSDVEAEFDLQGQFKISWALDQTAPEDSDLEIRLRIYERDGSYKFNRHV